MDSLTSAPEPNENVFFFLNFISFFLEYTYKFSISLMQWGIKLQTGNT